MTARRTSIVLAAALALTGCGGNARLPAAVKAPAGSTTTTADVTTTTVADSTGCTGDTTTRSYDPGGGSVLPQSASVDDIRKRKKLVVGVSADTLLFGSRNPISGKIEGFDIDVLTEVAKAIFGGDGRDHMEFKVITYAQRLPALESKQVDVVAHTMTITCKRWQRIAFSSEYYAAGQKILVKKSSSLAARNASINDVVAAKATVCGPTGSTNIDELSKPKYAGIKLIERPDISDCLVAMQQGDADAASGDDTVLAGLAAQDPNTKVIGDQFTSEPYGLGINKDQVDLVKYVNAVLERMRTDGTWARIYQTWLLDTRAFTEQASPPAAAYGRPEPKG